MKRNYKDFLIEMNEQLYKFLEENVTPFTRFCQEHGLPIRVAPKNVAEYVSYVYWCKANDLIALGGDSQHNEIDAYYITRDNFIAWERHKFFEHVLDNDTE